MAETPWGRELEIAGSLGIGSCMDVELVGNTLYVGNRSGLQVYDVSVPASPRLLGSVAGVGSPRQITVQGNIAYVTAREQGLFLVSVADPRRPHVLSHYDTIELATGIEVSGPVAYVACRNYGVELIDVRDPAKPRHLSTIRTGEAQSLVVRDGILYVGDWHERDVAICDVRNPWQPMVLSKAPLDGYGDGVFLHGTYCFAATGHHARGLRKHDESDPAFGGGHGLDILDVSNPGHPRPVSSLKLPRFYHIGLDMWDVAVRDHVAVVGDTHNGVFVVDVADPAKPRVIAHRQLPIPKGKDEPGAVGGFAMGNGVIYVAGAQTDLHVIVAPEVQPVVPEADAPPPIPERPTPLFATDFELYRPDGQVWAIAAQDSVAYVACGAAGLHVVDLSGSPKLLRSYETQDFAVDVKVHGNHVYVAEGKGGLSIWRQADGHELRFLARLQDGKQPIRQVVLTPDGARALLAAGQATFLVADVSNPEKPEIIFRDKQFGLLYGYQIAPGLLDGRYGLCFWHVSGAYWYDLRAGDAPKLTGDTYPHRISARNGFAPLADGQRMLYVTRLGKYAVIDRSERRPLEELPRYGVEGINLQGKPTIHGNRLYVADRFLGQVTVLDIADLEHPRLLARYEFPGNPCLVLEHSGRMLIPGGYDGLLIAPVPN
jgi:hypothetical protein